MYVVHKLGGGGGGNTRGLKNSKRKKTSKS